MSELKVDNERFANTLRQISRAIRKASASNFAKWGRLVIGRFKMRGVYRKLRYRSGDLAKSFSFVTTGQGEDTEGKFFSRSKYARLHEYGGTVKPKHAKMLAIPIEGGPAMLPSGIARYETPLRLTLPKAFQFWVQRADDGDLFLMGRKEMRGKGRTKIQPWFKLQRSAYIKPRLGFRQEIKSSIQELRELIAAGVTEAKRGR